MKKNGVVALVAAALLAGIGLFGCSNEVETASENGVKYGSLIFNTEEASPRKIDGSDIKTATINVYSGSKIITKSDVALTGGTGSTTVDGIPYGKNCIVEVIGYKANGVEGKRLYAVTDILQAVNTIEKIEDGPASAKGKAYLALKNAGVDITKVTLSGFADSKSSYTFDAESFATAYKTNSSVNPSAYYTVAGTLTLSKLVNANGYTIWVNDPSSDKLEIKSNSQTSGAISNVAPGEWTVYVNDGNSTKNAGKVNMTSSGATFDEQIGHNGYRVHLYNVTDAWTDPTLYAYSSDEANNNGWNTVHMTPETTGFYLDLTYSWIEAGSSRVIFYQNDSNRYPADGAAGEIIPSGKTEAWYDLSSHAWTDAPDFVSHDAILKSISVNGTALTDFAAATLSYNTKIASGVENATVTAVANDSKATVVVSPSGSTALSAGETKAFTITVTAEDETTTKTYTVNVTRKKPVVDDVSITGITVNGAAASGSGTAYTFTKTGSDESLVISSIVATPTDSTAQVSYGTTPATVASGTTANVTIIVTNGSKSATYTLTISYTQRVSSGQYGTNDKGKGVNKTISSWSDWTEGMQIARGAAYDDPRTWTGIQEVPYDAYALYAAYDDTNLYIMVELTNIVDRASFMFHDYAASDNAWWNNRDIPLGLAINTGAPIVANGPYLDSDSVIWGGANGGIEFTDREGFDWMLYHSSKYGTFADTGAFVGVGEPGFFHVQSDGYFSYNTETDKTRCLSVDTGTTTGTSGIDIKYMRKCAVSKTVNYESTPSDNRKTSEQTGADLMSSDTYTSVTTNNLDMSYWYTIPLSTLGIDKSYIETNGIGVRQLTTGGGSLMDCLPWDESMVDNAGEYYSGANDYSSKEKEDVDTITSPQARIGK